MTYRFTVPIRPQAWERAGRTRDGRSYTPKRTRDAKQAVIAAAVAAGVKPQDGPIGLDVFAAFAPPASWSKRKRAAAIGTYHAGKPDRDNILKLVQDALGPPKRGAPGIAYHDDAQVCAGVTYKFYAYADGIDVRIFVPTT